MKKTLYVLVIIMLSLSLFSPYIDYWLVNLWVHFKLHFAAFFLIFLIISLVYQARSLLTLLSAIGLLINMLPLLSHFSSNENQTMANNDDLSILSINLWSQNKSYDRVHQLIKTKEADMIILLEYTPEWHKKLEPILTNYTFKAKKIRTDNFGMAVYSKLPMRNNIRVKKVPEIDAQIKVNDREFHLLARHPNPPTSAVNYSALKQCFIDVKQSVQNTNQPAIVAGDLNTSSYIFYFKNLIDNTRLKDAFKGKGLKATWPSSLGSFGLKLDHFLVSESVKVKEVAVVDHINSDHLPIFMRFNLQN